METNQSMSLAFTSNIRTLKPWELEEDFYTGWAYHYPYVIIRQEQGHLCGYVGVPPGHEAHGKSYMDDETAYIICHGGLTFSSFIPNQWPREELPVGIEDYYWFLGFDCAHYNDIVPFNKFTLPTFGAEYRTVEFVREEIQFLASQLEMNKGLFFERWFRKALFYTSKGVRHVLKNCRNLFAHNAARSSDDAADYS